MFQLSAHRLPRILGETDCWSSGGPHKSLSSASPRWGSRNIPPSWLNTSDKDEQAGACGRPPSVPAAADAQLGLITPATRPRSFHIKSRSVSAYSSLTATPFLLGLLFPRLKMSMFCQCSKSHTNAASRVSLPE